MEKNYSTNLSQANFPQVIYVKIKGEFHKEMEMK